MSCAAFTLLGMWVLYANKSNEWTLRAIFGLSVFCLLWACFLAWRDKEKEVKELEVELKRLKPLVHNVQCVGVTTGEKAAQIGFKNVEITNQPIGNFREARLRIEYYSDSSGEEIAVVFPARWIGHDKGDIEIGPVTQSALLAFFTGENWKTIRFLDYPLGTGWLDRIEYISLPSEKVKIKATLFGEHNISIPTVTGMLTLKADGSASFAQEVHHL